MTAYNVLMVGELTGSQFPYKHIRDSHVVEILLPDGNKVFVITYLNRVIVTNKVFLTKKEAQGYMYDMVDTFSFNKQMDELLRTNSKEELI